MLRKYSRYITVVIHPVMSHVLHRTRATSYVYNQFYVHGDEDKSCLREHLRHFQQQHVGGHFFRCLADALSHSWGLSCTEPVTAGCSFKKKEEIKRNQSLPWWQHKQHVNETNLTSMLSFSNRRWVTSAGHSFWQTQWGRTGVEKKKNFTHGEETNLLRMDTAGQTLLPHFQEKYSF